MERKEFVIIHGLNGSPVGHWQDFLYRELNTKNYRVYFPQFSENSYPRLNVWLNELNKLEEHIHSNTVIIAHSMGVILWLYYLEKYRNTKVLKTILVAPPSNDFLRNHIYTEEFSNFPLNKGLLRKSCKNNLLIASRGDKYCPETAKEIFVKSLELEYKELPSTAGHINIESGFGKWEEIFEIVVQN
ncbi:MAG: alpha/beta hydrolase [Fusobacteriaceae bacterium]|nr:alpha/beta hydrolase [Fusobacteriaceae bacterium]